MEEQKPQQTSTRHPNRRKKKIVNKPMQHRMIASMSLVPACALSAMLIVLSVSCYRLWREAMLLDIEMENLTPFFLTACGFVVAAAYFILHNSVNLSHRVAGPAYKLCLALQQIRNGDIDFEVRLRQGDHLTEIRDELNLLIDKLNENPPPGFNTRGAAPAKADAEAGGGDTGANAEAETAVSVGAGE